MFLLSFSCLWQAFLPPAATLFLLPGSIRQWLADNESSSSCNHVGGELTDIKTNYLILNIPFSLEQLLKKSIVILTNIFMALFIQLYMAIIEDFHINQSCPGI